MSGQDASGEKTRRGRDRRQAVRLNTERSAATRFQGINADDLPKGAQVTDISEGGLRLICEWPEDRKFPLAQGDGMGFSLRLEGSRDIFDLLGRVRRVERRNAEGLVVIGVQFCGLDADVREALKNALVGMAVSTLRAWRVRLGLSGERARTPPAAAPRRRRKLFLGEILVRQGALDQERLRHFLTHEFTGRRRLGEELAERGLVNETGVAKALAEQQRCPYIDLNENRPDLELARRLPRVVFEKHGCVPVAEEDGALLVAMGACPTLPVVEELREAIGQRIRVCIAAEGQLGSWRSRVYGLRYSRLVEEGFISAEQLEASRQLAREEGVSIESVLTTAFRIPREEILAALGGHCGCPTWAYDASARAPEQLIGYVSDRYEQLKAAGFAPVGSEGRRVRVAMTDPRDRLAREKASGIFHDREVEFLVAMPDDIAAAIDRLFGVEPAGEAEGMRQILKELSEGAAESWDAQDSEQEIREDDGAVVRLVNQMVEDAHARGASDIHIEPARGAEAAVRYRIDGLMHRAMTFPPQYRSAVISRIKVMADLDIAERRKPQSGKIRFRRWGRLDLELRVETFPSVGGVEDASLRILAASRPRPLDELELGGRNLAELQRLIGAPHGLILCVGPTGSGKTTTLHSALAHINTDEIRILTVEDPVEITQPGLRQVQVAARAGVTFASALRSFLRADPDVIMIGELRDAETADIAVQASMTGHLVLSTLHTNSAPETVVRLLEMGVDNYALADVLLGVLAQRLVRTLCPACRQEAPVGDRQLAALRREYGSDARFDALAVGPERPVFRPAAAGCGHCHASGYRGRMAVHELLTVSETMRELFYRGANAADIRRLAIEEGMRTLLQDGIEKVLAGRTTIEEVRGVCGH